MRDFEKKQPGGKKEEPQPGAPLKAKPRSDADLSRQHAQSQEGEPPAKAHAEILRDERFAHPANAEPLAGLAVRVTWLPCGYACEHVGGHEIEPASSVTVPLPDPVFETASV